MRSKTLLAREFISSIRTKTPQELVELIARQAGPELTGFFFEYSELVHSQSPEQAKQNTSTLMLIGYLIHQHEVEAGAYLRLPTADA